MDTLHAEALALRDHLDGLLGDLAQLRDRAAAFAEMAGAAVPSMPDGKPIPPRLLEAARDHYAQMRATSRGPSKTALCQRLRDDCFKLSEEMEQAVWRHLVAADPQTAAEREEWDTPVVDDGPASAGQVTFDTVFAPGGFASMPESVAALNGTHPALLARGEG